MTEDKLVQGHPKPGFAKPALYKVGLRHLMELFDMGQQAAPVRVRSGLVHLGVLDRVPRLVFGLQEQAEGAVQRWSMGQQHNRRAEILQFPLSDTDYR